MFRAFSRPSSGAVNKRQDNKLENCCIRLVIYLNRTMMHGLTNLKFVNFQFFHIKPCIISGLYFVRVNGINVSKVKKRTLKLM